MTRGSRGSGKWAGFGGGYMLPATGGGAPDWVPANAVAHANFIDGHYYAGGAERAATDIFVEETNFGDFDFACIVPGEGMVSLGEQQNATFYGPLLTDALPGCTIVLTVDADVSYVGVTMYEFSFGSGDELFLRDTDLRGDDYVGLALTQNNIVSSTGVHKMAFTFTSNKLSGSIDGNVVITGVPTLGPVDRFTLFMSSEAPTNDTTTKILSMTVYPAQDDADLPGLSTLP
jgi:hypothetical protein